MIYHAPSSIYAFRWLARYAQDMALRCQRCYVIDIIDIYAKRRDAALWRAYARDMLIDARAHTRARRGDERLICAAICAMRGDMRRY